MKHSRLPASSLQCRCLSVGLRSRSILRWGLRRIDPFRRLPMLPIPCDVMKDRTPAAGLNILLRDGLEAQICSLTGIDKSLLLLLHPPKLENPS